MGPWVQEVRLWEFFWVLNRRVEDRQVVALEHVDDGLRVERGVRG